MKRLRHRRSVILAAVVVSNCAVGFASVIAGIGTPLSGTEGIAASNLTLATFSDSNPSEPVSSLSSSINWGDGTASAGTIVSTGGGGFSVVASHTYAEEGVYSTNISATEAGGNTVQMFGTDVVADAPLSPSVSGMISGSEGGLASGVLGSFNDANLNALPSDFTATINWGDGTASAGTISASGGSYSVSGAHVYVEEGSYTPVVTINDDGGSTTSFFTAATVADAPINGSFVNDAFVPNVSSTQILANFVDANMNATASDFSAIINWGDGTNSAGTIVNLTSGQFAVQGSHTYSVAGKFTGGVTLQDVGGSTASANGTITVAALPEPTSFTFVAAGLAALLLRRFKK